MIIADDLRLAWTAVERAIGPVADDRSWSATASPTDWSCRDALDHVADALCGYATSLSNGLSGRGRLPRNGDAGALPSQLLEVVTQFVGLLATVAEAVSAGRRAFHPSGMADTEGFIAMACDEILVHGRDIALALSVAFAPPADLAARVRDRLFPWAPTDCDPWQSLLWANGRVGLPKRARLEADWWWHSAPLSEWSGERRRRNA